MRRPVLRAVVILALLFVIPTSSCTSNLTAQDYNQQGMSLVSQSKYEDAVTAYTKAISLNSKDAQFYVNRGIAYINLKKFDLAIADFDKAIELDPKLAIAYANRGCAYASKGGIYINLAIANFNKTIELSKNTDLTAYARKMLESLTKIPPPLVVIPQPPPITDTPPVVTTPPKITGETQQGTVTPTHNIWPDVVGEWHGIMEFTVMANYKDGTSYECRAKGEFSFNITRNEFFKGTGNGAITGSTYGKEKIFSDSNVMRELKGNFSTTYTLEAEYSHTDYLNKRYPDVKMDDIRVCFVFSDLTPSMYNLTATDLDGSGHVWSTRRSIYLPYNLLPLMQLKDGATSETVNNADTGHPTLKITLKKIR